MAAILSNGGESEVKQGVTLLGWNYRLSKQENLCHSGNFRLIESMILSHHIYRPFISMHVCVSFINNGFTESELWA